MNLMPALRSPTQGTDLDDVCAQVAVKSDARRSLHAEMARVYQSSFWDMRSVPVLFPAEDAMPLESLWHPLLKSVSRVTEVVRLPQARAPEAERVFWNLDLSKDLFERHVVTPCLPGHFDLKTDVAPVSWRSSIALLAERAVDYETGKTFVTDPVYAVLMTPQIKPSSSALSRMQSVCDNSFLTLVPRNSVVDGKIPLTSFAGVDVDYFFARPCPRVLVNGVEQVVCRYHAGLTAPGQDRLSVSRPDWDHPDGWCAATAFSETAVVSCSSPTPGQKEALRREYDRGRFPIVPRKVAGRSLPIAHDGRLSWRDDAILRLRAAALQRDL